MKILLLGKTGQVGSAIFKSLNSKFEIISFSRAEMTLDNQERLGEALEKALKKDQFNYLINAAAFTDVESAEKDSSKAYQVNGNSLSKITEVVENMKGNKKKNKITIIHFSTDYAFDGSGENPWTPYSNRNPINEYGKSKVLGEKILQNSKLPFLILRTSWVFSSNGNNFLKKIVSRIGNGDQLQIVDDQIGSPTSANFISGFCEYILKNPKFKDITGIFHLTSKGSTNWYEFAKYIVKKSQQIGLLSSKEMNLSENISPIKSSKFLSGAKRPKNSRLDCSDLDNKFSFVRTSWIEQTDKVLKELLANKFR